MSPFKLCALAISLILSTNALAQAVPQAIIPMQFTRSATGFSDTNAVENAVRAVEHAASSAGYGSCVLNHYSYYYWSTWNATATMTCYKDTTPPPPPNPPEAGVPPTLYPPVRAADGFNHLVWWQPNAGCTRLALNRRINGQGWQEVYKGGDMSWNATNTTPGTYDYKVLDLCTHAWSSIATIIISAQPQQPTPPQVSATVGPNFTIEWGAVSGADTYRLEQESGDGWSSAYIGPNTSWSITGMRAGTYRYRIVACANGRCSAPSSITELRVVSDMTPIITYLLSN